MIDAYPLQWPAGWPRTTRPQPSRFDTPLAKARDGLTYELELLGARDIVISSNAKLLKNGQIAARQGGITDAGIAAYFTLNGDQRCIPVDKWDRIEDNLHAAELTVAALRGLERWGAKEMVNAAFAGFAALPAGGSDTPDAWWTVLGVEPDATEGEVRDAYLRLAKQYHPDASPATANGPKFLQVKAAYDQARKVGRS